MQERRKKMTTGYEIEDKLLDILFSLAAKERRK